MRLALVLFILLYPLNNIFCQTQEFSLTTDRTEMTQDQYIELSFTLENGQGKAFMPPDFTGWTIINGPSTSSQVSIINGVRQSSISYIYSLSPKTLGDLTIGKASIQVNGKTMYSTAVKIKVKKSNPNRNLALGGAKSLNKKDIFILATATPEKAYVGQQVLVEYKLYTAVNVDNYNIAHTPDFKGFHVNNTPRGSFDSRETLHGRTYVTKVIYTASIYPIQSGSFELDPMHVRANVVSEDENDPNAFFLLPSTEGVDLMSNAIPLNVLSLPVPSPDNFSGAVGRFKIASSIDQLNLKVNDAVALTVYLEGDGDLNRVGKPFIQTDSTAFQSYEPKITKENTDYRNSGFVGMRELIYPLVASTPGTHRIVPSFVYFNTDSQRYITASPQVFNVTISGTAISPSSGGPSTMDKSTITVFPLIQNPHLGHDHFVGSLWYFILLILPLFTWAALALNNKINEKSNQAHQYTSMLSQTKSKALQEINALAQNNIPTSSSSSAITHVNDVLKDFLRKKWNITDLSLSNSAWKGYIDRASLDGSIKAKLQAVLEESEKAMYGGQMTREQFLVMISQAKEIIENC